jgi:hypothetical protein
MNKVPVNKYETHKGWRYLTLILCLFLAAFTFGACDDNEPEAAPADEAATEEEAWTPSAEINPIVDQVYTNENFMIEMLVNDSCVIQENGANLVVTTVPNHIALIVSIIPGIQNLAAAAELAKSTVMSSIPDVAIGEAEDANFFGARSKMYGYQASDGTAGYEIASIINQTCYFINIMIDGAAVEAGEMTEDEFNLIMNVLTSVNILRPTQVEPEAQTAVYETHYPQVPPAPQTQKTTKPVSEWSSLPYAYYSWWGDPGDYYSSFPYWYYEPDWDYYSDPGDYWDWGWDDDSDWWFYDEYGDYYGYDYYQDYDDYWDDYDPWSDPGDGYDEWSDSGDYSDDGYGDYVEDDGWGDYAEDDGWGDYADEW